jgi:hypothetical protein
MNENNNTTSTVIECDQKDDLGYDLVSMYRFLFGISCVTAPLGALLNIVFVIAIVFRAKKVFNVNNHALLLSCLSQVLLGVLQGPIRVYIYYHNGCLPKAGTSLCAFTVYLDYIPTQINNFLVAQLSIERFFLVVKPLIFHRGRHHNYSPAICLHYVGLFVAIAFPCLYYPIIMHTGAAMIALSAPSTRQTCDLSYESNIYETFDLLITFAPYFFVLTTCLSVIGILSYRKCVVGGQQGRRVTTRNQRRLFFSLHLFLIWFFLTWSPWVLYDFFRTILNLTYSIYIDAITTYIVYLNYTFSSTIVLITFKEMRQFWFDKFRLLWASYINNNRIVPVLIVGQIPIVGPVDTPGPIQTVRYVAEGHRIANI